MQSEQWGGEGGGGAGRGEEVPLGLYVLPGRENPHGEGVQRKVSG